MLKYILGLIVITVLSLTTLVFFVKNTDPYSLRIYEFIIFYLSLFLGSLGIFSLTEIFIRRIFSRFYLNWKMVAVALRHAIILASILTLSFLFLASKVFNWQLATFLIFAGLVLEILFRRRQKKKFS